MQTNIFMIAGALLAVLPSLVPAQRLLQPTYAEDSQYEPDSAASGYSPKRMKLKKATENWALAEKRQRQNQQSFGETDDYAPAASHHRHHGGSAEQESAESSSGGGQGGPSWGGADESSHDGSRVHFHVQGHKGPKSYRFGYDTGKGPHRHFRYEERDEHGMVHGRYGFHDKHGDMHVFHYSAHPHHGYRSHKANPHHYG